MRIDVGPGYRVYYGLPGSEAALSLCGGDKSSQDSDIKSAIKHWIDYQQRTGANHGKR